MDSRLETLFKKICIQFSLKLSIMTLTGLVYIAQFQVKKFNTIVNLHFYTYFILFNMTMLKKAMLENGKPIL